MKKEYDFAKAELGKFYNLNAKIKLPVYLDEEAFVFVNNIAKKKHKDVSFIVNQMIHTDMQLAEVVR